MRMIIVIYLTWWLKGERGRVGVEIMLTPEHPPRVQKLGIISVQQATPDLERAVSTALEGLEHDTDLAPVILPIRRKSWVNYHL